MGEVIGRCEGFVRAGVSVTGKCDRVARLRAVAEEILVCSLCGLHKGRTRAVPGEGPSEARIMLVGEAPGREEDFQGRPFVGRSGKVLGGILQDVGLRREEIFITSVVKCRPPRNRMPRREEYETCIRAHLRRQIQVVEPSVVCLLGGVAARALLGHDRITQVRGQVLRKDGVLFFPTFHPAAAGRSRIWRRALSEDMSTLRELVRTAVHLRGYDT